MAYLISLNFPVSKSTSTSAAPAATNQKADVLFSPNSSFTESFHLPVADQCSALHAETLEHHLRVVELGFRQTYLTVGESHFVFRHAIFLHDDLLQLPHDILRRQLYGFAHVESRAARRSCQIVGHHVGVDAENLNRF